MFSMIVSAILLVYAILFIVLFLKSRKQSMIVSKCVKAMSIITRKFFVPKGLKVKKEGVQSHRYQPGDHIPAEPRAKVGRNHPCPCGSGKKYKMCCIDKIK